MAALLNARWQMTDDLIRWSEHERQLSRTRLGGESHHIVKRVSECGEFFYAGVALSAEQITDERFRPRVTQETRSRFSMKVRRCRLAALSDRSTKDVLESRGACRHLLRMRLRPWTERGTESRTPATCAPGFFMKIATRAGIRSMNCARACTQLGWQPSDAISPRQTPYMPSWSA